jgi:hypothetical protein
VKAAERPIVVTTFEQQKELPDASLRRCFFHYTPSHSLTVTRCGVSPRPHRIQQILVSCATCSIRDVPGSRKAVDEPELLSTGWFIAPRDMLEVLQNRDLTRPSCRSMVPCPRMEVHVMLPERLAFMACCKGQ